MLFGSPTVNKGMLNAVGGILEMIGGIGFKNKKGAAFGAYGWSGETVKLIEEKLKAAKIEVVQEGIKELWNPDKDALERCFQFGKSFAEKL